MGAAIGQAGNHPVALGDGFLKLAVEIGEGVAHQLGIGLEIRVAGPVTAERAVHHLRAILRVRPDLCAVQNNLADRFEAGRDYSRACSAATPGS